MPDAVSLNRSSVPDSLVRRRRQWPALFLRASGLVYVNADVAHWRAMTRAWGQNASPDGSRAFYGRLSHEIYHYAQFFACGYMTGICQDHFVTVKRACPSGFDAPTLQAYLARPQPRPAGLDAIAGLLRQTGPSGLSPLEIIEGCARLFQALSERPGLLHGAYLLELTRAPPLYAPFHHAVAAALGERALAETLFLGAIALEFSAPQQVAPRLIALRAAGAGETGSADPHVARAALVDAVRGAEPGVEHLGSALSLAQAGRLGHPLLGEPWLYHASPDWERDIRDAVWGRRRSLQADFLGHAEVLLNDAIWTAPRHDESAIAGVEAREIFARIALHVAGGAEEDSDVQPAEHGA
ncbi:hypothetical protein [Variovorax sp. J22P240]|uniref:hypothetical protein n=1 Tax=Variovorax sp. J22P240 TaxID=3053514 RepID=UPI002575601D|nr:hypothetical protein [Variovorax sp. J22P240]